VSTIIKQYGLMRSGTCYTQRFIHDNFKATTVVPNVLGWKHGPYRPEVSLNGKSWLGSWNRSNRYVLKGMHSLAFVRKVLNAYERGNLKYVVTVRNPYTWLMALAQYKQGVKLTAGQIRQRLGHWNKQHRQWLRDIPSSVCFVPYESLRDKPAEVKERIAGVLDLEPTPTLKVQKLYVAPGADHGRVFKPKPYEKRWNARMLKVANSVLDRELMRLFGYAIMEKPIR